MCRCLYVYPGGFHSPITMRLLLTSSLCLCHLLPKPASAAQSFLLCSWAPMWDGHPVPCVGQLCALQGSVVCIPSASAVKIATIPKGLMSVSTAFPGTPFHTFLAHLRLFSYTVFHPEIP